MNVNEVLFWGTLFFIWLLASRTAYAVEEPPAVDAVTLVGVRGVPTAELKTIIHARASEWYDFLPFVESRRFDRRVFEADISRLLGYYRDQGYFETEIDTLLDRTEPGKVRIRLQIQEGLPRLVSSVAIEGLPSSVLSDSLDLIRRLKTRPGFPITRERLEWDGRQIGAHLQDRGYAFAELDTLFRLGEDIYLGAIVFRVGSGVQCDVRSIFIVGNREVSEGVIRRGITFREGMAYSREALRESQRQLYRSGIFRSVVVGVPDTASKTSPVDVAITVSERPSRRIRVGGGFDTEEKFKGSLEWTHRNFLGGARQFQVASTVSSLNRRAQVGLRQPYFGGSRNWLNLGAFAERETVERFQQDEVGANMSLERNLTPNTDVFFQARSGVVDFQADSLFSEFRLAVQSDTRDDFLDPSRGRLTNITVRERGVFFQGNQEFAQVTLEVRWYQDVNPFQVFAFKVRGGVILDLGRFAEVPNIERFFGGGLNSVRGWGLNRLGPKDGSQEPIGGDSLLEGSVEFRFRFSHYFGGVLFLEAGNVAKEFDAFDLRDLKWAVGTGIRYLSPVGPVRFDLGIRLSEDGLEPKRVYHLSLGQAF